jgi:hypothetical protein
LAVMEKNWPTHSPITGRGDRCLGIAETPWRRPTPPRIYFLQDMESVSLQGKLTSGNSKKDGFPFNLSSSLQQTVSVVSIRELSLATKW